MDGTMVVTETQAGTSDYDVAAIRADFPIFQETVYGQPLTFLDSGASAQKPRAVIEAMSEVMNTHYANVHRGAYHFSQKLTDRYEGVRETIARFINAASDKEIVFAGNATAAINLVAYSFGQRLQQGDEVIVTEMEHHANIVPWQLLRQHRGIELKVAPITDDGALRMDVLAEMIGPRTKLVAVTHVSNVLGTVNPIKEIARLAHAQDVPVLVDGSQGVVHAPVDVQDLDVDFYVFTGHKLYGPTGIGVLYGKADILADMPPFMGGGDMIRSVSFAKTTFAKPPHRFEAGTPPIIEGIGLGAAIDYVNQIGMERIAAHEQMLLQRATQRLSAIEGLTIYGSTPGKCGIVSFTLEDAHAHDVGTIVDRKGVAIRVGHHCAQPLMERLGVAATARASFGMYTTVEEIEVLATALEDVQEIFGR